MNEGKESERRKEVVLIRGDGKKEKANEKIYRKKKDEEVKEEK